ncbi:MAG: hypothetical protein V3T17_07855 [Pseudomonadales bacterium]
MAKSTCAETQQKVPPQSLSATCLYSSISSYNVSNELNAFTPNYPLWSDSADKSRWIHLPPGTKINTNDPDRWVFPVGTQFFKEFRKKVTHPDGTVGEIRVETRHLMKIKSAEGLENAWSIASYAWQADQKDATLNEGERNVLDTSHHIPSKEDCIKCHKGNIDGILGFDIIQLSDRQAKYAFGHGPQRGENEWSLQTLINRQLTSKVLEQAVLPGTAMEQKVLGYLHANCGNCHNPMGHAAEEEAGHLKFRHKLAFQSVEETDVYRTAVNQTTRNFTIVPYIVMGAAHEEMALYKSALFLRMNSLDEEYRMPMIAREEIDYDALSLMHQWILTLPTPEEYNFAFNKKRIPLNRRNTKQNEPMLISEDELNGAGLYVKVRFNHLDSVPAVMIVYWPEDEDLRAQAVMDHKEGDFTEELIVGNPGSIISLRNSDEVGHTIYVKDKRRDIRWQLNYMPPGSRFKQALFWDEDVFVEMRCRLHLYMSAWVGAISSRYYTVVEFEEGETEKIIKITDFPPGFSQVKVWLPKMKPIHTHMLDGETKYFDLARGQLTITRLP